MENISGQKTSVVQQQSSNRISNIVKDTIGFFKPKSGKYTDVYISELKDSSTQSIEKYANSLCDIADNPLAIHIHANCYCDKQSRTFTTFLTYLAKNKKAESIALDVSNCNLGLLDVQSIYQLSNLTVLKIGGNGLGYFAIYEIQHHLSNIEELHIEANHVTDDALVLGRNFTNLRVLNLNNNPVSDRGVSQLWQSSATLRELHLAGTKVTNSVAPHIEKMTNLEVLELDNTEVSNDIKESLKQGLRPSSLPEKDNM